MARRGDFIRLQTVLKREHLLTQSLVGSIKQTLMELQVPQTDEGPG